MSWQLASYGLLALALIGGFAWYERTRPDAKIVALVGTLAAFGALGRIAFAALPNVKPTTDIVLVSGFALGGPPGFVVGAVAALASNFFFGQGPWTPWQMLGWGATGVIGAGLATVTRGRIGRWPLAVVCFVVGFGFTALQDTGDWVTYSDHSLGQLGVYVGKGIGFDLIHATGCLLFALAFGPALIRSLKRFRLRLQVQWIAPLVLVALIAIPTAIPTRASAASDPVGYLLGAQNRDGGFGSAPGQPSSSLFSGWVAMALAAGGVNPADTRHGGPSLLDYLEATPGDDPDDLERTILALHAAGAPVGTLATELEHDIRASGSVSDQTNLTAFAVLALRAAGVPPPARMIRWLARQQDSDGGFNFATAGGSSDVDDTGAVLQALAGTGHTVAVARAVRFIRSAENRDGGFPSQPGATSNAQSTAFAVQGLIAVGASVSAPLRYLRSLIAADGHVDYARGVDQTPVWVTAQAEMALAGKPLPVGPVPSPARAVAPAPVARKPPARRRTSHAVAKRVRRDVHRRVRRARAAVPMDSLIADAAVIEAIVLAPVNA